MSSMAHLALEDGSVFSGRSFGAPGEAEGEVVFNTSMTGYQEILSDPSYCGQIVTMTCPHIGNYGVTTLDDESHHPFVEGFVVREACEAPSNHRSQMSLPAYLQQHRIPAMEGVDTREITLRLREKGFLRGVLSTTEQDPRALVERARDLPLMVGRDLVVRVTREDREVWTPEGAETLRVALLDLGAKRSILRCLCRTGCRVEVFPAATPAEALLEASPDAVFLSNGPGDPAAVDYVIRTVREILGKLPVYGICLGHQILSLALGAQTYQMKFGHHGANHPVLDLDSGRVEITVQNHGFAVAEDSLAAGGLRLTHRNLNDGSVEGIEHVELPARAVQFHPEAAAGPHDSRHIFPDFVAWCAALHGTTNHRREHPAETPGQPEPAKGR